MASFRPLQDRVLIKVLEAETRSKGGIIIPETAKEKPCEAEVIAVGPGKMLKRKFEPTTVKPGDLVIYSRNAGQQVEINGVPHIVMREEELFAVIKKAQARNE